MDVDRTWTEGDQMVPQRHSLEENVTVTDGELRGCQTGTGVSCIEEISWESWKGGGKTWFF